MNIYKYILRSLWYFRKKHFVVFLGIVISTAVLTGALIIGDSVKYSLFKLVDLRLGKAKYAMQTGDRFVRSQLARELSQKLNIDAASLLILNGIAINTENQKRVNKTQIVGIDSNFWKLSDIIMPNLLEDEVIINSSCAHKLNININEELLIRVDKVEEIPANAPFVAESNPSVSLRVKIKAIANDELLGRFSLQSNQITLVNIFVSRDFLAKQLKLVNLSNTILIAGNSDISEKIINRTFSEIWKLEDVGLSIRKIQDAAF